MCEKKIDMLHPENNGFKIQKAHWIDKMKLQHLFDQGENFMVLTEAKIRD